MRPHHLGLRPPRARNQQRFSAKTNDWTKAYAKVAELDIEPNMAKAAN
jgi:hypothetical protein